MRPNDNNIVALVPFSIGEDFDDEALLRSLVGNATIGDDIGGIIVVFGAIRSQRVSRNEKSIEIRRIFRRTSCGR